MHCYNKDSAFMLCIVYIKRLQKLHFIFFPDLSTILTATTKTTKHQQNNNVTTTKQQQNTTTTAKHGIYFTYPCQKNTVSRTANKLVVANSLHLLEGV